MSMHSSSNWWSPAARSFQGGYRIADSGILFLVLAYKYLVFIIHIRFCVCIYVGRNIRMVASSNCGGERLHLGISTSVQVLRTYRSMSYSTEGRSIPFKLERAIKTTWSTQRSNLTGIQQPLAFNHARRTHALTTSGGQYGEVLDESSAKSSVKRRRHSGFRANLIIAVLARSTASSCAADTLSTVITSAYFGEKERWLDKFFAQCRVSCRTRLSTDKGLPTISRIQSSSHCFWEISD